MKSSSSVLSAVSLGLLALAAACSSGSDAEPDSGAADATDTVVETGSDASTDTLEIPADGGALAAATVLDLDDVKTNPAGYTWFDFRPNVKKLILAGAAETEHIAILWYTTPDGGVGLHYHAKTESVYVIDGTQTDAKGMYPTGVVYFNPPGSGHQITDSTGFFLLAYAAPPDFVSTNLIGEYTPVRVDTKAADLMTANAFVTAQEGVRVFAPPLDTTGGLSGTFIESMSSEAYVFHGNYLLVLDGSCAIEGTKLTPSSLVVGKAIAAQAYKIAAAAGGRCLAMGVSF